VRPCMTWHFAREGFEGLFLILARRRTSAHGFGAEANGLSGCRMRPRARGEGGQACAELARLRR